MLITNALVQVNRYFELLLIPECDQSSLCNNKYFIWKCWDYSLKNLWHKNAPNCYKIKNKY